MQLTPLIGLRISPAVADSLAFKPLFDSTGVLGRESGKDALKPTELPFMGCPNRSSSILLANGGVIRESIPVIPDEMDDYREARA